MHARYEEQSKRAYVELRDADDDGGEMLATAVFSFRTKARLSKREIDQDVERKARYLFGKAALDLTTETEDGARANSRA